MATVLMGILWKRVNYAGGLFGLIGGVLITASLLTIFGGSWTAIPRLHFFYIGGIAEVLIMIGIAVVTLMTAPPDGAKIAPYVWHAGLLRTYDEGVRRPWYQQLKLWCAIVTVIWLFLYWKFW
jgi:Na+/proline symporter